MPNWTAITLAIVKTGKISVLVDAVQGRATLEGDADPTTGMIADVSATLRAAVSNGNSLDSDLSKVPNSLKGMAIRMITRRLKDYLDENLTELEAKQADDDSSYLNRIIDKRLKFETPDDPDGSGEMGSPNPSIELVDLSENRRFTRATMIGL